MQPLVVAPGAVKGAMALAFASGLCAILGGCASVGVVRSAQVEPGRSVAVQAEVIGPPGEPAAWLWSVMCAYDCNQRLPGGEVGLDLGSAPPAGSGTPWTLGFGLAGILRPYGDLYLQLGSGATPWGVGGRLGVPLSTERFHTRLYGRFDVPLRGEGWLLVNPALFVESGTSPNGRNRGRIEALLIGLGYLDRGGSNSFIPAAALVWGRSERDRGSALPDDGGPVRAFFATFSITAVFHRDRS